MAKKIQRSFYKMKQKKHLKTVFKAINRLQTLYRVRNEYKKFKDKQKKLRKLQRWFRHYINKQNLLKALEILRRKRRVVTKMSSLKHMKDQRDKYTKMKIANLMIVKHVRSFLAKTKFRMKRYCKSLLTTGVIFEKAWRIIRRRFELEAAIVIQRYARGYITRKLKKKEVNQIKKFRFYL